MARSYEYVQAHADLEPDQAQDVVDHLNNLPFGDFDASFVRGDNQPIILKVSSSLPEGLAKQHIAAAIEKATAPDPLPSYER